MDVSVALQRSVDGWRSPVALQRDSAAGSVIAMQYTPTQDVAAFQTLTIQPPALLYS